MPSNQEPDESCEAFLINNFFVVIYPKNLCRKRLEAFLKAEIDAGHRVAVCDPRRTKAASEPKPVCGKCNGRGCVVESVYGFPTTKEPCPCSAPAVFNEEEIQAAKETADRFESGGSFRGLIEQAASRTSKEAEDAHKPE